MSTFSIHRFASVARWDTTINRAFYLRAAFIIFIIMAAPALLYLCGDIAERNVAYLSYAYEVANVTIRNFILIFPFLFGYLFHNLMTKQGRINELTLAATNLEKFLWHTCLIVFGSLAVAIVSFFLIDMIYNLGIAIAFGTEHTQEFVGALLSYHAAMQHYLEPFDIMGMSDELPLLIAYLAVITIFAVGNAYKYRHNIPTTLLWLFVLMLLMLFLAPFALFNNFSHTEVIVIEIIVLVLIAAGWALTYHLYCRAAITARRNR